jgi:hypothetical protein
VTAAKESDVEVRPSASPLFAARSITIKWFHPDHNDLRLTQKDGCWSATIQDVLKNMAVFAVKPGEKSREIFVLNKVLERKIHIFCGGEFQLSNLEEVVIEEIPGRQLLEVVQSGIVNIRLKYATSQCFMNVSGLVTWSLRSLRFPPWRRPHGDGTT